jgi:hypothetical protein
MLNTTFQYRSPLLCAMLLAFPLALAACSDSSSGPGAERYTLATIDGAALPGPYAGFPGFEVTSGSLKLLPDGSFETALVMRCKADPPPNTTCEVTGDERATYKGTYIRDEDKGVVRFSDQQEEWPPVRITILIWSVPTQPEGKLYRRRQLWAGTCVGGGRGSA